MDRMTPECGGCVYWRSIELCHWLAEIRPWRKGACKSNLCDKRFHRASARPTCAPPLLSKNGALSVLDEMKLPKPISLGKILQRRSDRGQKEKIGNPTTESEWTELLSFQAVYLVPAEVQPALTSLALSMRLFSVVQRYSTSGYETRALWGRGSWESTARLPPSPWVESDEPRLPDRQQQSRRYLH